MVLQSLPDRQIGTDLQSEGPQRIAWADPGQPGFLGMSHAPFKPNVDGPWIDPDAADAQVVRAVVTKCPSGSLSVMFCSEIQRA